MTSLLLLQDMLPIQFFSRTSCIWKFLSLGRDAQRFSKSEHPKAQWTALGKLNYHSEPSSPALVLGIETSCDDTGAAVVDETGKVLGEALHSQKEVHLKTGGIIPPVAQRLHQENIDRVVNKALFASGITPHDVSAIATTVKPGLSMSLGVGLAYSLKLVEQYKKPFIPIHHMEAHALTVRLTETVDFPFLVLLISGGHCILAMARGVSDFLLLGQSLDEAPGDTFDKVARRLSLIKHAECSTMSGGQALEHLAQQGDRWSFTLTLPMTRHLDCNFSFAGLRNHANGIILRKEKEEGLQEGQILSCVADIAAVVQHTVALHIVKRTHRAILYCQREGFLPQRNASLVVSGGVASNQYIRRALQNLTVATELTLRCPPPRLCTDNGIMIAWNGIERLHAGLGVLHSTEGVRYEPKSNTFKMLLQKLQSNGETSLHFQTANHFQVSSGPSMD